MKPIFKTIDLDNNFDTCIEFRRDSYFVSFNTHDGCHEDMENYRERMVKRVNDLPEGNSHLWFGQEIIGQSEMKLINNDQTGYVSLFYLKASHRSQGFGKLLHWHTIDVFRGLGKHELQLSVSKSNKNAICFYISQGWSMLGPRPGKEQMFLMSYNIQKS